MEEAFFEATIRGCNENHNDLTGIDLSLHALVEEKVSRLAKCLEKNTHVTSLDLFGVKYDWTSQSPAPWVALFNSLPPQLTHLELGSVKLGSAPKEVSEAAFRNIGRLKDLNELSLSANEIQDSAAVDTLCGSLAHLGSLHEFLIQNNKLSDASGEKIAQALNPILLKENGNLTKVWMQGNGFSKEGSDKIRNILQKLNGDSHRLEL